MPSMQIDHFSHKKKQKLGTWLDLKGPHGLEHLVADLALEGLDDGAGLPAAGTGHHELRRLDGGGGLGSSSHLQAPTWAGRDELESGGRVKGCWVGSAGMVTISLSLAFSWKN